MYFISYFYVSVTDDARNVPEPKRLRELALHRIIPTPSWPCRISSAELSHFEQCIQTMEKTLEFSSTVLSTLPP